MNLTTLYWGFIDLNAVVTLKIFLGVGMLTQTGFRRSRLSFCFSTSVLFLLPYSIVSILIECRFFTFFPRKVALFSLRNE